MSDQATTTRGNKPVPSDGRDPDVRVPSRVRAAAQRSEELLKARNGEPPAAPEGTSEGNQPGITIVPQQPAPQPPTAQLIPTAVTSAPPANAPVAPPTAPAGDKTYSENDFNAMKARWERANRDAQRLSEEVSNLRNVVATMQSAPPPAAAHTTPPELQASSLLTPQEIADYGPEFLDVVGKKAREIAGAEVASLKQQIEQLSRGMQTTTQMTMAQARDAMLAQLDEKLPEWRNLNTDQNFLSWLRLPDPFSGAIRQDLLNAAYEQNNAPRVQAFFQGFLAEEAVVAPANAPSATTPGAAPARVPLETFAAPGRAKSAAASAPAEKPIITRAQVAQFYADVAAGKYRGREAERIENEGLIFAATKDHRIR